MVQTGSQGGASRQPPPGESDGVDGTLRGPPAQMLIHSFIRRFRPGTEGNRAPIGISTGNKIAR
jgi:hypothetical protein